MVAATVSGLTRGSAPGAANGAGSQSFANDADYLQHPLQQPFAACEAGAALALAGAGKQQHESQPISRHH